MEMENNMWDLTIGKAPKNAPCAAHLVSNLGDGYSISANQVSYWVNGDCLGIGLRIYTGTREYDRLRTMLDDLASPDTIKHWIDKVVIRHAPVATILQSIRSIKDNAYREGRESVRVEIKQVLFDNN